MRRHAKRQSFYHWVRVWKFKNSMIRVWLDEAAEISPQAWAKIGRMIEKL